ncbi:nuclear transport factor 2 family protein [Ruegeria hyattellae]|uniref:nuclear transport factor 2 family protein n=1 Tax=Ruegeria hyattellae TaxID=3233337 RepID=UPI00355B4BDC
MSVTDFFVDGTDAIAELRSRGTALNGRRYNNEICRVMHFGGDKQIRELTIYLDSALIISVFEKNE